MIHGLTPEVIVQVSSSKQPTEPHPIMAVLSNGTFPTVMPTEAVNGTRTTDKLTNHNWGFLVAVLATAISVSIIIALLAKCQVVRRYLASYRHTRLREMDSVSQCDQSGLEVEFAMQGGRGADPDCIPRLSEEEEEEEEEEEDDDDGFIEDNYIPASERARAERAAENMEDSAEEMDEIEFSIT